MPTELVFRADAYQTSCPARVVGLDEKGIVLDRTVFYATSGGQPGDSGQLRRADGATIALSTAVFTDSAKTIIAHVPAPGAELPAIGEAVTVEIDWGPRFNRMRMHTALHLLSVVLPYPVTGGSVSDGESRLDFDIPDAGLDKDAIAAKLNALIATDAGVSERYISEAELDANPALVKTMSVQPPRGAGTIRLVEIAGLDLQPCGGTHVRRTSEIGRVEIGKIENKGRQNRRVTITLA